MRRISRKAAVLCAAVLVLGLLAGVAFAKPITKTRTISGVDYVSAGVAGVNRCDATITLTGVTGPVRQAFLFWHGVALGSGLFYDNPTVVFNGSSVTGVGIGDATTNCWGPGSSRAFRADVTALVTGNGTYTLTGLVSQTAYSANGASLVVIFDDGNPTNNRDLVFYEGNDSNYTEGFPGEDAGWHAVLNDINYGGGSVFAQLHGADGQNASDGTLSFASPFNTVTFADDNTHWDGVSVPSVGCGRNGHGLWDIHTYDVTSAFGPSGLTTLNLDGQTNAGDCLGLVAAIIDLPTGAAPTSFDHPPTPACGTTFTVNAGSNVTFTVQASNPRASSVTLSATGVPAGATLTPALPTSGNPVSTDFLWTPGAGDIGSSSTVTFTAVDSFQQESVCAFTINVTEMQELFVSLASFGVQPSDRQVGVSWETALEVDNQGFFVWKRDPLFGAETRVSGFIPAIAQNGQGATYSFTDKTALNGVEGLYFLEDVDLYGVHTRHPFVAAVANPQNPPIRLQSPAYGAQWSTSIPLTLTFEGKGSALQVLFSSDPKFADPRQAVALPVRTPGSLSLTRADMARLGALAQTSHGILYWEIVQPSRSGVNVLSQTWRLDLMSGNPYPAATSAPGGAH